MTVTKNQIVTWLEKTADVLIANKEYLTELDSAIGDADHGINMDRGFRKVNEKLPSVADKDIGSILKTVGMTLISSVGGASRAVVWDLLHAQRHGRRGQRGTRQ